MARPNRSHEKRAELMPIVASAFSELGYRKATTAELAARCGVQENILYRLWPDKKKMFTASIDYMFDSTIQQWQRLIEECEAEPDGPTPAQRILAFDAEHRGERGFYRITFAALSETDDDDVKAALRNMYGKFVKFIDEQIVNHRGQTGGKGGRDSGVAKLPDSLVTTWAILGIATAADIGREVGLLSGPKRHDLVAEAGRWLLDGKGM